MKQTNTFYDFSKDLPVAQKTEAEVARLLEQKYELVQVTSRATKTNAYDLLMYKASTGQQFTFEVKEDFTHAKTGNIGVEFSCRGKDSGVMVSKADFYIYKVHNSDGTFGIYLMKTERLKFIIEKELYFRIVNGGDVGSNSMNYLFKDYVFYKHSKKIG